MLRVGGLRDGELLEALGRVLSHIEREEQIEENNKQGCKVLD